MSQERHLHIADEYDRIAATVLAEASIAVEKSLSAPFPSTDPFEKNRVFSEREFFSDLIQVGDNPEELDWFNNKYEDAQIINHPVSKNTLKEPRWCEQLVKTTQSEMENSETVSLNLRKELRRMFLVPEGEDSVEFFKAIPWNTWLDVRRAGYFSREAIYSIVEQVGIDQKTIVKAAASIAAVGVLVSSISGKSVERSEQAMGPDGIIDTALVVDRRDNKATVPFNSKSQEVVESEKAAEELLGVTASDVVIKGDKIEFSGKAEKASDEKLIAATMEAQRPDAVTAEITPEPKVQEHKFPITPEEKFTAEVVAVEDAIKHAVETGDAGPLNHLVTYSPIFQPRYDLPSDLENSVIRSMPPANLLGIDRLVYEFAQGSPDKERLATAPVISLALVTAYKFRETVESNPEYIEQYPDSCIRMGDLSADEGHKTHWGSMIDITSAIKCDIENGRTLADGPVFWINHTSGGMDQNVANPMHSEELDNAMLVFLTSVTIDGETVAKNVLYSKPNSPDRVGPHANHSNHIHVNAKPAFQDMDLKDFANGGERPEINLDQLRGQIFADYEAGVGVEGISKQPTSDIINSNNSLKLELSPESVDVLEGFMSKIEELKPVYLEIEKQTGVPWQLMAALHNREGGNRPDASMFAGEKIGSVNPDHDTPIGSSLLENGIKAAEHFKSMAKSVYGVEISPDMTVEQLQYAFLAYNRGGMYKNAKNYIGREMTPIESPYVMNGLVGYENMLWPSQGNYSKSNPRESWGEPNSVQGKPNKQLGAMSVAIGLGLIQDPKVEVIDVAVSGDSLIVGQDKDHANIEEIDSEFGVNVVGLDARGGRALSRGEDNGMDSVERLIASGAISQDTEVVYLAYGTNYEEAEQYEENLRKAIARIGEVSNAQIVMPLIFSEVDHAASRNEIINRVAQETGAKVINPGEGLPLGDGLHPDPDGYKEMARRILKEVSETDVKPAPTNNPAPTSQPSAPVEAAESLENTLEPSSPEASVDSSTTTEVVTEEESSSEEPDVKEDEIWFTEQKARNIYEVWFTEKIESDNGELVNKVDEQALNEWMTNNVLSEERNGQTIYQIDFNNVPNMVSKG